MSRKTAILGSFLVLATSFSFSQKAAAPSSAAPKLTAEQVVDKNIAARGGASAWRAVQTLSMSGKMQAGGNDRSTTTSALKIPGAVAAAAVPKTRPTEQVELPFRMELKRPRKSRMEIDFHGQAAVQVYDGTNGWKLRPFLNRHEVEPYTADQLREASRQADLDGPLVDYAAKGTKIEMEGIEKVEGTDNYRLKLTYKNGDSQKLWVNSQTFLETKIEGTPRRLDGKMHPVEIYYRDYKPEGGLLVPHVLETVTQGVKQTEKIEIEKVAVNPKLDDARFAKLQ
jgi:outer membrane lipoprotein-sorting protein